MKNPNHKAHRMERRTLGVLRLTAILALSAVISFTLYLLLGFTIPLMLTAICTFIFVAVVAVTAGQEKSLH